MRKRIVLASAAVLLVLTGSAVAAWFALRDRPSGHLESSVTGVSYSELKKPPPPKRKRKAQPAVAADRLCWRNFGGDEQRTLARPSVSLGRPTKILWARAVDGFMEYQPSYCNGTLYVNTERGTTYAINAATGKTIWRRRRGGAKPSTPAIAGDRLIVSSTDGTVTALDRSNGHALWQIRVHAKVESSPVVIGNIGYVGATDGRVLAFDVRTGRVRWAYDTGGRINSSPSIWGDRLCITTYAGSIFCLGRSNGHKLWHRYVKRNALIDESFYASASTDGKRLFTISRDGKVVALSAVSGRRLWTHDLNTTGYSTPAIAHGRVFIGDFRGYLHAYRARDGKELWRQHLGGKLLGPALVAGGLVFCSNLETQTYGLRARDGKVVWHIGIGKYSPGIVTERHYYFSLNGILMAALGRHSPKPIKLAKATKPAKKPAHKSRKRRVTTAPKR